MWTVISLKCRGARGGAYCFTRSGGRRCFGLKDNLRGAEWGRRCKEKYFLEFNFSA